MKIERENDIDEIHFSFRIQELNVNKQKKIVEYLKNRSNKIEIQPSEEYKNLVITIDNEVDSQIIIELNEKFKNLKKIDITIGVISSYDHGGFTLPAYIFDIAKKTNCPIQFSWFT